MCERERVSMRVSIVKSKRIINIREEKEMRGRLDALEDYKTRYGKIVWEIVIQDGRISAIQKIGQEEIVKVV